MTITAKDVIPNAFLDDLGTDWIGVNAQGHIIARAQDQETVLKCGDPGEIVAAFNAGHLLPEAAVIEPASEPAPVADTPPPADAPPEDTAPPAPAKKAGKKKS